MNVFMGSKRKGSVMVEAAVIYPLTILSILTVIYILTHLYIEVVAISNIHLILTEKAAELSRTVVYEESGNNNDYSGRFKACSVSEDDLKIERKRSLFDDRITGETVIENESRGIVSKRFEKKLAAEKYVIDEEEFIRWYDLGVGLTKMEVY